MTQEGNALEGTGIPDIEIDVKETFGLDIDLKVPAFSVRGEHVPPVDESYILITKQRWRYSRALRTTDGSWCKVIMVQVNQRTLSRLQHV